MKKTVYYLLLTILCFWYLTPVIYMIASSFKPDDQVLAAGFSFLSFLPENGSWQNYRDVFKRVGFGRVMFNSVFITGTIMLLGLIVNSMAGYALARLQWPGRNIMLAVILALLVIPFEAIAVPMFYQMTSLGLRDSYAVQIIPFIGDAFSIYLFYSFFIGFPKEIEEAARIDGATCWQTFLKIVIPASKPVFATVAILTFVMRWGSYMWPLMVTTGERYRPLPVALAAFENQVKLWGDIMAFGVMMVLPLLLIFLVLQKWFVEGLASSGLGSKN